MTFVRSWAQTFGFLATLICDSGTEYQGVFALAAGQYGCLVHVCDTESPWQNGRTERSGGSIKRVAKLTMDEHMPTTEEEVLACVYAAVAAKNRGSCQSVGALAPIRGCWA